MSAQISSGRSVSSGRSDGWVGASSTAPSQSGTTSIAGLLRLARMADASFVVEWQLAALADR